jgi:hypothetical protein
MKRLRNPKPNVGDVTTKRRMKLAADHQNRVADVAVEEAAVDRSQKSPETKTSRSMKRKSSKRPRIRKNPSLVTKRNLRNAGLAVAAEDAAAVALNPPSRTKKTNPLLRMTRKKTPKSPMVKRRRRKKRPARNPVARVVAAEADVVGPEQKPKMKTIRMPKPKLNLKPTRTRTTTRKKKSLREVVAAVPAEAGVAEAEAVHPKRRTKFRRRLRTRFRTRTRTLTRRMTTTMKNSSPILPIGSVTCRPGKTRFQSC